jgi:hypothetical protein
VGARLAKLRAALSKPIAVGIGCLILGLVAGFFLDQRFSSDGPSRPPFPPSEYLYIDPARAVAYLSQLQGGQLSSEKVTQARQTTSKLAAAVSFGSGEVSVQGTQTIESQLLSTLPSEVYNLRKQLNAQSWQNRVDLSGSHLAKFFKARRDGEFITLDRCQIQVPLYGQLYEGIRQSGELGSSKVAVNARAFVKHVGSNPIIPLTCALAGVDRPTVLIPIQYSLLASDGSLLIGNVTVLGKVAYGVPADSLDGATPLTYTDLTTRVAMARVIRTLPLDILHLIPALHGLPLGQARKVMLADLVAATQIRDLGLVVIPTAIFK